jgi:curved DNA-binding protein CbpA
MARAVVTEDYYSTLEVSQFATLETIRESYKKLALRFHPDKNRDKTATSDFQRLARAWETLKDPAKRSEYDKNYVRTAKRRSAEEVSEAAARAKRRREDLDRQARGQWGRESAQQSSANGDKQRHPDEEKRGEKARAWKALASEDYLSRLQTWVDFRNGHMILIFNCRSLMRKHELDLEEQTREDDSQVIRKFHDAIDRSLSSGHMIPDHAAIVSKLMDARKKYTTRLQQSIEESRRRLDQFTLELETAWRLYEEAEAKMRQDRTRQSLEILGPRELNPPLFSIIGRRGRAINYWTALSRVKAAVKLTSSFEGPSEGPWHYAGEWEHVDGEHICGRCDKSTFHIIPECGPARCPGCEMVVCNDCCRDLKLLREYGEWLSGSLDDGESLFSLEFDSSAEPTSSRDSWSSFNTPYGYTDEWKS